MAAFARKKHRATLSSRHAKSSCTEVMVRSSQVEQGWTIWLVQILAMARGAGHSEASE